MRELAVLLLPWVLSTIALFRILAWDEARMPASARASAFPSATRLSAVVVFGILALPVHVARTRRGLWRVVGPPLALVLAGAASGLLAYGVESLVDLVP